MTVVLPSGFVVRHLFYCLFFLSRTHTQKVALGVSLDMLGTELPAVVPLTPSAVLLVCSGL